MIKGIGEGIRDSVNEAFAQYSDEPYLDTEIFFDPLSLVFVTDETTDELVLSEEWGQLYMKHVDHYMTKIKKYPKNWEELLPSAPGVDEITDSNSDQIKYIQQPSGILTNNNTTTNNNTIIILIFDSNLCWISLKSSVRFNELAMMIIYLLYLYVRLYLSILFKNTYYNDGNY